MTNIRINSLLLAILIFSLPYQANANGGNQIQAGQHYQIIADQIRQNSTMLQLQQQHQQKVQVIMLFSYSCHVCERIYLPLEQWAKTLPKAAIYTKKHVVLDNVSEIFARIFYSLEKVDPALHLDEDIFHSLHKKHLKLWVNSVLHSYISKNNIDLDTFKQSFQSYEVDHKIKQMKNFEEELNLEYTPIIIVNGPDRSYSTDLTQTHSLPMLFKTLDYLVNLELRKS